jgi:hypothetical protein
MLTRQEFRMLFGLPKRKSKTTAAKKTVAKKTAPKKTKSSVGKKVVKKAPLRKKTVAKKVATTKPKSLKLGKKLIGGVARTVYKSVRTGAKYYKKVVAGGAVKRMYLGKPVKKIQKKTRFGYVNSSAPTAAAMAGPFPMTAANGSAEVGAPKAPAAAFGKKRKAPLRKKTAPKKKAPLRKKTVTRKTSAGKKVLRKKTAPKKTAAKKTVTRKAPIRKKVVRKSRFGLSHGRPSGLSTGPYPF